MKIFNLFFILLLAQNIFSQKKNIISKEEIETYKEEVKEIISVLEFTLNTIGDEKTSLKNKKIIFNETYKKIFLNDEVQIEDDLDTNRKIIVNKNIVNYLRDINFFFKNCKFVFQNIKINHFINDKDKIFFKVNFNRNLDAIDLNGNKIVFNKNRYVEINLDIENEELKIASIYTTKLNSDENLKNYWNNIDISWKKFIGKNLRINDTLKISELLQINDTANFGDTLINLKKIEKIIYYDSLENLFISKKNKIYSDSLEKIFFQKMTIFFEKNDTTLSDSLKKKNFFSKKGCFF
ncbi:MAG: hypothetical protein B6I24_10715 [Bacteroidetes bacterium 4572_128]|nr:MAG: hypothetical protein B6I24_10715 [Bacteroidetes bacterium 4572_128]